MYSAICGHRARTLGVDSPPPGLGFRHLAYSLLGPCTLLSPLDRGVQLFRDPRCLLLGLRPAYSRLRRYCPRVHLTMSRASLRGPGAQGAGVAFSSAISLKGMCGPLSLPPPLPEVTNVWEPTWKANVTKCSKIRRALMVMLMMLMLRRCAYSRTSRSNKNRAIGRLVLSPPESICASLQPLSLR